MKKKFVLSIMVTLTIFACLSASSKTYAYKEETIEKISIDYLEIISDSKGKVTQKNHLSKEDYQKKVKEHKIKEEKVKDLTYEAEIVQSSMDVAVFMLDGSGSGSSSEIYCSVFSSLCDGEDVYNADYTIHTTVVKVYPNRTAPISSSIVIDDVLEWETTPTYRMRDLMSISWDGDDFSEKFSTIESKIEADYTYIDRSGFLCLNKNSSSHSRTPAYFNPDDDGSYYKLQDNGIIFQPNLGEYHDEDPVDPWAACVDEKVYTNIKISTHVELIIDNANSIYQSSLTNTSIKTEYIHFWEQLSFDISANAGISLTGPSAGISLTPSITTHHDGRRTNYLQFLFTNRP